MTTLIDPRHMLVLGPNCLFQEVLDEYGIVNAWQGETNFGAVRRSVSIGWRCIKKRM